MGKEARWTGAGVGVGQAVLDARTRAVVKRMPMEERGASAIQVDTAGRRAFVACPRDHVVAVVDLGRLERVSTIDVGREPDGVTGWGRQANLPADALDDAFGS